MNRWFHPEFENDLISAARYYEAQRMGLGREFIDATEAAIVTIADAPERWPERHAGMRRYQLERFPFLIRYRLTADTLQFLSILHGARHPDTSRTRL